MNKFLKQHFDRWLERADKIAKQKLTYTEGKKYIRVIRDGGCAFCFINKLNGDVLKASGWKAPAKHARGNIFEIGKEGISEFGGLYIYR